MTNSLTLSLLCQNCDRMLHSSRAGCITFYDMSSGFKAILRTLMLLFLPVMLDFLHLSLRLLRHGFVHCISLSQLGHTISVYTKPGIYLKQTIDVLLITSAPHFGSEYDDFKGLGFVSTISKCKIRYPGVAQLIFKCKIERNYNKTSLTHASWQLKYANRGIPQGFKPWVTGMTSYQKLCFLITFRP